MLQCLSSKAVVATETGCWSHILGTGQLKVSGAQAVHFSKEGTVLVPTGSFPFFTITAFSSWASIRTPQFKHFPRNCSCSVLREQMSTYIKVHDLFLRACQVTSSFYSNMLFLQTKHYIFWKISSPKGKKNILEVKKERIRYKICSRNTRFLSVLGTSQTDLAWDSALAISLLGLFTQTATKWIPTPSPGLW